MPRSLSFAKVPPLASIAFFIAIWAALYAPLLNFSVSDFNGFVKPWLDYIRSHGGFSALSDPFSEYAPPYLYLLATATYLHIPVSDQALVKLINIPFVLLISFSIFAICRHFGMTVNSATGAAAGILILPTVGINAFVWGQADTIYASLLLLTVLLVLKLRPYWAIAIFTLAISTKLQAIFLGPFILFMIFAGRIPWRSVIVAPPVYAATLLPAALIGRPLGQLLTIYLVQGRYYNTLSMNAPNFYFFLDFFGGASKNWQLYKKITMAGLAVASLAGALIALLGWGRRNVSDRAILLAATVSMTVMPYVLPKMHDRFFFGADVFSYALACVAPQFIWAAVAMQASSLLSYAPEFSLYVLPGNGESWKWAVVLGAVINTVVVVCLSRSLWRELAPAGAASDSALGQPASTT